MFHNVMLFFHILGAAVMFAAVGITLTTMIAMLHAKKTEALREWSSLAVKMDGFLPLSVILILLPGLYLVISSWGWGIAWVNISLVTLVAMTIMGPVINLRRLKAILTAANAETNIVPSAHLLEKVRDRILWNSVMIMSMLVIAILFMMTVKPALVGSLITIAAAIVIGCIAASKLLDRVSAYYSASAIQQTPLADKKKRNMMH
jgi:uncharacterized membrane protein